jgi:hypothetical protein
MIRNGLRRIFFCSLLLTGTVWGQTFFGTVVGTVTDSTGGSVPAASVTITNTGTSDKRAAQTDSNGAYQFVSLVPGTYRVDVEKPGFKRFSRTEFTVEVQATVRVDAALEIGDVGQVVEVTAQAALLQTDSSALSQVVEGRTVQEMPLNGRNVLNLVSLVPGVVPQGSTSGNPMGNQNGGGTTNVNGWGNYQIGGGMANQSASYLDGSPLNVSYINAVVLIPTQDAVQEFRVATNNVSPEFGRFAGGVVNLTTKSGTNDFHGSAYEYLRNRDLNANNFFNNRSNIPRSPFTQNQYGVSGGGRLIRDKAFFFGSWENFSYRQGVPTLSTVPTQAMRLGDFSAAGIPKIYDPLTVCGFYNNPSCPTSNGQPVYTRQAFTGNIVPPSRIDPTAAIIKDTYGLPTQPGIANNFATNSPVGGDQHQYNSRGDQSLSDKQRLFERYTYWNGNTIPNDPFQNKTNGVKTIYSTHQAVVGDTYTLTPSTILDIRGSYLRFTYGFFPPAQGDGFAAPFGPAYAALQPQMTFPGKPGNNVTGFNNLNGTTVVRDVNNVYAISATLTKIAGRHSMKFGGEVRRIQWNYGQTNNSSMSFTYDNGFTAQNPLAPTGSGYPFASFLLGYPATGVATEIHLSAAKQFYDALYATDTFQVSRKLTLNYGVRWDFPGAFGEKRGLANVILPNAPDPLSAAVKMNLTGLVGLVDSNDYSYSTIHPPSWNLFAPRVGFAWRADDKTVIRGGYGISFLPNDVQFTNAPWNSPSNSGVSTFVSSLNGGITPANSLSNPFPSGLIQPPGRNQTALATSVEGGTVTGPVAYQPYPYAQQWNLNIERDFWGGTVFEVGYAGAKGTHIPINTGLGINQLADEYDSMGAALTASVPNPFFGILPASAGTLAAATTTAGQLLRPHPQFLNLTNASPFIGNSNYHSLQTKVQRRFRQGGTILATYTWSKLIGDSDTLTSFLESSGSLGALQDYTNLHAEKSLVSFNVAQRAVVSYVLDLPFGKGKKYLSNLSGPANHILGGWGVNGVTTLQSGFPIALSAQASILQRSFGAGTTRPNVVPGCDKITSGSAQSRLNNWFNGACFTQPGSFAFGTESRTDPNITAHGIANWDVSVFKDIAVRDRIHVQFRSEFFNIFNRVQFSNPGAQVGTAATYGIVTAQRNFPRQVQFALRATF